MAPPLAGLRVLDAATFVAAPYAAAILGEFGAEVLKIENPTGGDPWRRYGTATGRDSDTLAWLSEARNKRSVPLDLRDERGAALFRELVVESDVVCENFRPGTMEAWGLGYEPLSELNPGLVMLRVSGYGQSGPYAQRPGFARVAQAFGGLTHLAGMPDGPPVTPGSTSLADYVTGLFGAVGVLVALRERDRSGLGQVVDIGLFESIFRLLDELAPAYDYAGVVRGREGTGTALACPHGHFPTGDGHWVALACTADRMFERLVIAMQRPELLDGLATTAQRLARRSEVEAAVTHWTSGLSRTEVLAACERESVPCGPVNTIEDIFADPQFAAREMLLRLPVSEVGEVVVPGVVPKLSRTPGSVSAAGPALGDAVDEILGELLGRSPAEVAALVTAGVTAKR
ncbi:MAG: CoA transferase [Actinobacteria bacterium]|nr:CoA transferase [Actinomycetota bacterium]